MRSFECEGINISAAGIIFGLMTIDRTNSRHDHIKEIELGASWLASRTAVGNAAGLFTGNAGVALVLAITGLNLGNQTLPVIDLN